MRERLMALAVAFCTAFPGTVLCAEGEVNPESPPDEGGYATILTWADTKEMSESGEIDVEAISEGGYSVIRTSWVPPKDGGFSAYPLWGIFPDLLERAEGGTVTAYDGTHPEGRGHLLVFWGNISADQAVICAGFGSYKTHSSSNSQHHVPIGPFNCPPSPYGKGHRMKRGPDRPQS